MKKNVIIKYGIGVLIITIVVLAIQFLILYLGKMLSAFGIFIPIILLILSITLIPLIGLNIVIKECIKKEENSIKISSLLSKFIVINIILILLSATFVTYKFNLIPDNKQMLVLNGFDTHVVTTEISEIIGQNQINLFIINNIKIIILSIIISFIYTTILTITFIRNKINNIIGIEPKSRTKQLTSSIVISLIFVIIGILSYMGLNNVAKTTIIEGSILLERNISNEDRKEIENSLNKINEIISYEYESQEDTLNEFKEKLGNSQNLLDSYNTNNIFPESYNISLLYKDAKKVEQQLKKMKGIQKVTIKALYE